MSGKGLTTGRLELKVEAVGHIDLENAKSRLRDLEEVVSKNKQSNYVFDKINDIKLIEIQGNDYLSFSMLSDLPDMLSNNVKFIRVILSKEKITSLNSIYDSDTFLKEFFFNVHDYVNYEEIQNIKKNNEIKSIKVLSANKDINLRTSIQDEDSTSLLEHVIKNKKSAGKVLRDKDIFSKFIEHDELKDPDMYRVSIKRALMKKTFLLKDILDSELHIKILETNEEKTNYYSIEDYTITESDILAIKRKRTELDITKNNFLQAKGVQNKKNAEHKINVLNESGELFDIYKKKSIYSDFEIEYTQNTIDATRGIVQNFPIKIKSSKPAIYRTVDNNKKFEDIFIGDVKSEFFSKKPIIHTLSGENGILLVVKNVPHEYEKFIITRQIKNNKKTRVELKNVNSAEEIPSISNDILVLKDLKIKNNTSYSYQIKFILKSGIELISNISNDSYFIIPEKVYGLSSDHSVQGNTMTIKFETSVPDSLGENIYSAVRENFPNITDDDWSNINESFSYIAFVKLMSFNLNTGEVSEIEIKTSQNNEAVFKIDIEDIRKKTDFIYFGEMFASPLVSLLENNFASSGYDKSVDSYVPSTSYLDAANQGDKHNFISKFFNYDAISFGTITYGKALAEKPGKLIETGKTGLIEFVDYEQIENTYLEKLFYTFKVVDHEIPRITIQSKDQRIKSAIVLVNSSKGIEIREEKSLIKEKFTFYDIDAKNDFLNETITYYIIPVYNNYRLGTVVEIGTVLCLKDDFRSL